MSKFCWALILAIISGAVSIIVGLYAVHKSGRSRVHNKDRVKEPKSDFENSINDIPYGCIVGPLSVLIGVVLVVFGLYRLVNSDCSKEEQTPTNINVKANSNTKANTNSTVNTNASLAQLQERIDRGIKEERYEVRRYYNNEVVQGKFGKYYTIDLRDADSKELILFNLGKYIRDEYEPAFRASMYRVKDDIIIRLASEGVSYKLYVRGSADILGNTKPYIGTLRGDSREVTYLLINPNDPNQYIQESHTETIPKAFANKHLPNLRAAYIQDKLQAMELTSVILDGSVTGKADERDRNALILLTGLSKPNAQAWDRQATFWRVIKCPNNVIGMTKWI